MVRMIVNPLLIGDTTGTFCPIVDVSPETNKAVDAKFEELFGKPVAVIRCAQSGNLGMAVVVSAALDLTDMGTTNLVAYSYDPATEVYAELKNAKCTAGSDGFVHLQTEVGGYIVITISD